MSPEISLRKARPDDFDFAFALYLKSTRPLLEALGLWDAARVRERFLADFKPHNAQLICAAGRVIGWMQVSRYADGLHIDQLHLEEDQRNRGIGTRLIKDLMARARANGYGVGLNVIRGNPARRLYERLGFRPVGEEADKVRMRWDA